jgi:hypothetical protein
VAVIKIGDHFIDDGGGGGSGGATGSSSSTGSYSGSGNAFSEHIQTSASGATPSMESMPKRIQAQFRVVFQFLGDIQGAIANAVDIASLGVAKISDLGSLKLPLIGGKIASFMGVKGRN